jgi:hypothetical protein
MHSVVANGTQVPNSNGNPDNTVNCVFSASYAVATNTYSGSFTCTGIKSNITAVHIHNCDKSSYSYYYQYPYLYTCSVMPDCTITLTATGGSWSCAWPADNSTNIDAICNDQCYFNVHTDDYGNGEVRGNMVSMAPICNVAGGVKLDGVAVVAGVAPASGIQVPAFYYGQFLTPVGTSPGNCFFIVSFQPLNLELIISGCCWGLSSNLYSIEAYQAYDNYQADYFSETGLGIENSVPFSFKIPFDEFEVALTITSKSKYVVTLYSGSDSYEYVVSSANFPSFSGATCEPYVPTKVNPTTAYNCYKTASKPDSSSTTTSCYYTNLYCGVGNLGDATTTNEDWDCYALDKCMTCSCGATLADLKSGYAVCCEEDGCNDEEFDNYLPQFCTKSAGSNISVGFLVSLFVALFKIWFN